MTTSVTTQTQSGVINAVSAYVMWGFAPIYFKLLNHVNASEILIHRILWSCLLLAIIIIAAKKWRFVQAIAKQPKLLLQLTLTASILAVNWFLFIWAINNDHLLDASLGYFINPLLSVALGVIFLNEHLRKWQKVAVVLAVSGVLIQLVVLGSLPLISLALAGTFGTYGLLRKKMAVDSFAGLWFESLLMVPFAALYWLFFTNSASSNMFNNTLDLNVILILAGVVTTAPLLCFTAAAKRLTLSALGFFQYIGPSIMFVLATFLYHEPLLKAKLTTFILIWLALTLYSWDSWRAIKNKT
ncbi:MAG: EamA family transporter RarD [Alteromonadaceae bacterium]|nr:EamA family transporter RarD [Alteromonadaceae bacterium]